MHKIGLILKISKYRPVPEPAGKLLTTLSFQVLHSFPEKTIGHSGWKQGSNLPSLDPLFCFLFHICVILAKKRRKLRTCRDCLGTEMWNYQGTMNVELVDYLPQWLRPTLTFRILDESLRLDILTGILMFTYPSQRFTQTCLGLTLSMGRIQDCLAPLCAWCKNAEPAPDFRTSSFKLLKDSTDSRNISLCRTMLGEVQRFLRSPRKGLLLCKKGPFPPHMFCFAILKFWRLLCFCGFWFWQCWFQNMGFCLSCPWCLVWGGGMLTKGDFGQNQNGVTKTLWLASPPERQELGKKWWGGGEEDDTDWERKRDSKK